MPFEGNHVNDIGLETVDGPVCKFDVKLDPSAVEGKMIMKSPEEIFKGGVEFFKMHTNGDEKLSERLCRKNMNHLPYWAAHHFVMLDGEQASNEEYHSVLAKL